MLKELHTHTHLHMITIELILLDWHKDREHHVYLHISLIGVPNASIYQSFVVTWKRDQILRFFLDFMLICVNFFSIFCVGQTKAGYFGNSDLVP